MGDLRSKEDLEARLKERSASISRRFASLEEVLPAMPVSIPEVLKTKRTFKAGLAAGAGCGDGWTADNDSTAAHAVGALRQRVGQLGGQLMVLRQPETGSQRLPAWGDAPARAGIEAVKRQFDPQQQLCRGRLPGVEA